MALKYLSEKSLQLKLYNEILKKGLSVRQVEQLVKDYREDTLPAKNNDRPASKTMTSKDYEILRKHLSGSFGVPVKFACDAQGKGKITFPFKDEAELNKIISIFDTLK